MFKREWVRNLKASLLSAPAQEWMHVQNERERVRAMNRERARIECDHTTVVWTDRISLTGIQCKRLEKMMQQGWQIYGLVFSMEEHAYAVACRLDTLCGVLYPTGELDSAPTFRFRRVDQWCAKTGALFLDHRLKKPSATPIYEEPQSPHQQEQTPDNPLSLHSSYVANGLHVED